MGCAGYPSALPGALPSPTPPFFGVALEGHPLSRERLAQEEQVMGLSPGMVVFFLQWPDPGVVSASGGDGEVFPLKSVASIRQRGAVPCITWEPMYIDAAGREQAVSFHEVMSGRYDVYIRAFARQARNWGGPILIRFAHEMNLARYHWGTDAAGFGPESPGIYGKMFRYVVSLSREEGAKNLLWVFCPNAESVPNPRHDARASWNAARHYYPGDEWVDVLGMDGYNWGDTQTVEHHGWKSAWRGFGGIFLDIYGELRDLSRGKPIVVFEMASVAVGGDREAWVRDALEVMAQWRISGFNWFQVVKEQDWSLRRGRDDGVLDVIRRNATSAAPASLFPWAQGKKEP